MIRKIPTLICVFLFILACTPLRKRAITELPRGNTCVLGCDLKQAMETTRIVLLEMGFKIVVKRKSLLMQERPPLGESLLLLLT